MVAICLFDKVHAIAEKLVIHSSIFQIQFGVTAGDDRNAAPSRGPVLGIVLLTRVRTASACDGETGQQPG